MVTNINKHKKGFKGVMLWIMMVLLGFSSNVHAVDMGIDCLQDVRACVAGEVNLESLQDEEGRVVVMSFVPERSKNMIVVPVFSTYNTFPSMRRRINVDAPLEGTADETCYVCAKGMIQVVLDRINASKSGSAYRIICAGKGYAGWVAFCLGALLQEQLNDAWGMESAKGCVTIVAFSTPYGWNVGDDSFINSVYAFVAPTSIACFQTKTLWSSSSLPAMGAIIELLPWEDISISRASTKTMGLLLAFYGTALYAIQHGVGRSGERRVHDTPDVRAVLKRGLSQGAHMRMARYWAGVLAFGMVAIWMSFYRDAYYVPSRSTLKHSFGYFQQRWKLKWDGIDRGLFNDNEAIFVAGRTSFFDSQRNPLLRFLSRLAGGY